MDAGTVITVATAAAAAVGGFFGGKRTGNTNAIESAVGVVELLRAKLEVLESDKEQGDRKISELSVRIEVLESLVTQRADVEAVADEVHGVRNVVDRIAFKMGA